MEKEIKERIERLQLKLAERLDDAQQDAKYAKSSDEHSINQARADELAWCYNEIAAIFHEAD